MNSRVKNNMTVTIIVNGDLSTMNVEDILAIANKQGIDMSNGIGVDFGIKVDKEELKKVAYDQVLSTAYPCRWEIFKENGKINQHVVVYDNPGGCVGDPIYDIAGDVAEFLKGVNFVTSVTYGLNNDTEYEVGDNIYLNDYGRDVMRDVNDDNYLFAQVIKKGTRFKVDRYGERFGNAMCMEYIIVDGKLVNLLYYSDSNNVPIDTVYNVI